MVGTGRPIIQKSVGLQAGVLTPPPLHHICLLLIRNASPFTAWQVAEHPTYLGTLFWKLLSVCSRFSSTIFQIAKAISRKVWEALG